MIKKRVKIRFDELTIASQKGILETLEFIYTCNGARDPQFEARKKVTEKPRTAKEWRYYRYTHMRKANKIRLDNGVPEFYVLFSNNS